MKQFNVNKSNIKITNSQTMRNDKKECSLNLPQRSELIIYSQASRGYGSWH